MTSLGQSRARKMDGEGAPSKGRVGWVSNLAGCLEGTDGVESDGEVTEVTAGGHSWSRVRKREP